MIKNNLMAVLLVSALFLSALASCWSSLWWFLGTRELQALEFQSQSMTRVSNAMQALAADAVDYGRKNPGIEGVLTRFDLKPRPAGTGAQSAPKSR